jgi:hypothetical protein
MYKLAAQHMMRNMPLLLGISHQGANDCIFMITYFSRRRILYYAKERHHGNPAQNRPQYRPILFLWT